MPLFRTNHYYRTHAPAATLLGLLLLGSLPSHIPMAAAQQAETRQVREYDIASGSLGEVLSRFAAEAGILLSGDAALTGQALDCRAAKPSKRGCDGCWRVPG